MKFAEWVPSVVEAEYRKIFLGQGLSNDIFKHVVFRCSSQAYEKGRDRLLTFLLESNNPEAEKAYKAISSRVGPLKFRDGNINEEETDRLTIRLLADWFCGASEPLPKIYSLTPSERKKKSNRLIKKIEAVESELMGLGIRVNLRNLYPDDFDTYELTKKVDVLASEFLSDNDMLANEKWLDMSHGFQTLNGLNNLDVVPVFSEKVCEALSALQKTKNVFPQPTERNNERNLFAHRLRECFVDNLSQPLWEHLAAIIRIVFDDDVTRDGLEKSVNAIRRRIE